MKVYRIHIISWTASFRYPNLISGFQPTLPVPPMSTIAGLISAAMGFYFRPEKEKIGYVFSAGAKTVDLETIYQMGKSLTGINSNVIKREFMTDARLYLYTDSGTIADAFRRPYYPMLLGRSGDLATVHSIEDVEVETKSTLKNLKGTIVPMTMGYLPAPIQALPICFSDTIPRRNIGTRPYYLLDIGYRQPTEIVADGFSDSVDLGGKILQWDVLWQSVDL